MSAVGGAVRGGLTRKRVQTMVIGLVLLVSTGASVLAVALLVDSHSPFDHAFTAQRGADLVVTSDPAKASSAQLAATRKLTGVTAASGPFATATVETKTNGGPAGPGGGPGGTQDLPPLTLAGRASPGGPVDDVVLQSGHWPKAAGQLVLDLGGGGGELPPFQLGTKFTVQGMPSHPVLTLVGTAVSVTSSAAGWVTPAEAATLASGNQTSGTQMLYRFAHAGNTAAIKADTKTIAAALPAGAIIGTQSWLAADLAETGNISAFVPFLIAFGVIGLVMSALIVANVVSGAVVAGYRRIGILKSIGFTPRQIVVAYTSQAAIPAVIGCLGGIVLGNLLAIPVLHNAEQIYGVGSLQVPVWVDVAVPAVLCAIVGLAAILPALRAGRLSAVQAIAIGRAPKTGRGYAAHRLFGRLALPRPVTIGLAAPFARPARTTMTLVAILLGATAVTFAVGLSSSLNRVVEGLRRTEEVPVTVSLPSSGIGVNVGRISIKHGPGGNSAAGQSPPVKQPSEATAQRTITAALRAQPGTKRYVAQADGSVTVAGLTQQVQLTAFQGNASWTGYALITGHWYTGPGQAVVPTHFLTETGKSVGDTVTLLVGDKQAKVRIVGEVFLTRNSGLYVLTDYQTLVNADATQGFPIDRYNVALKPGVSAADYTSSLQARLGNAFYFVMQNNQASDVIDLMITLIGTLTLLLAIVAGLGVLNTIVLQTRERVHDLGVFKAVGMTPGQTIVMAICWVAGIGIVASVMAVPLGMVVHGYVLPAMAHAVDLGLPASFLNVYKPGELVVLGLAGIVIAVAGALLPASWAAATKTGAALHAE
ncbi:MAG TPA: FtsX-like permease family protein [Streptosporangiaceae bacterium]|jgi:putative ABC transport system permease protein